MLNRKLKVYAITGGIGSGKTTVCSIIKEKGYKVFSADDVYKELIKNQNFVKKIYKILELDYTGKFDSFVVSSCVFKDKEKLKKLNEFTHKKVMKNLFKLNKKQKDIVFNEVPLLFESGLENLYTGVIVVVRNLEDRINACIKRDNLNKEQILDKIKNQYDYEKNNLKAHTLIVNDGSLEELSSCVGKIIEEIKSCK